MKGDFTRDSFDPLKRFTRVLQQQGRVQLDADWNEQVSVLWHYLRAMTRGLIGPYFGPDGNCGFGVFVFSDIGTFTLPVDAREGDRLKAMLRNAEDFLIGPGEYYVDGWLCENDDYVAYSKQPDLRPPSLQPHGKFPVLIFLDVWERHITFVEDDSIREVALAGTDTTSRAKLVWQVCHSELSEGTIVSGADKSRRKHGGRRYDKEKENL
jgi:Family of unknown function (DUF6519)